MATTIIVETPLWWDIEIKGIRDQFNKFRLTREQAIAEFYVLHIKDED